MGTGEVARYRAGHGSARVRAAVLVALPLPALPKTSDSPEGIDGSVFEGLAACVAADRPAGRLSGAGSEPGSGRRRYRTGASSAPASSA